MKIELRDAPLNPWRELENYQSAQTDMNGKFGATTTFVGTMRDFNNGNDVQTMTLEHYPEMTKKHLEKIAQEAMQEWDILDVLMIHRYGEINPNDTIVILAIWSAHRDEAFQACRYLIEELKQRAPFWKKETLTGSNDSRWVKQSSK